MTETATAKTQLVRRFKLTAKIPEAVYQEAVRRLNLKATLSDIGCSNVGVIEQIAASVVREAAKVQPTEEVTP